MKRWGWALLLIVALLIATVAPSEAGGRRHWRGGPRVFVGLGFGPAYWYPYPYWYYPPPAYYGYAPPVVVQQPTVYVEQNPAPPASAAPAAPQQYWYYCEPAGAYYPSVPSCAEPWVKVPARSQP
jgi:hypothetical protein